MRLLRVLSVLVLHTVFGAAWAQAPSPERERLAANSPRTTSAGHTFTAPEGFSLLQRGIVTVLQAPEGDLTAALIDVEARDADDALAKGWAAYRPDAKRPLKLSQPQAARDGWEGTARLRVRNLAQRTRSRVRRGAPEWRVLDRPHH